MITSSVFSVDTAVFPKSECKKISIVYEEHSYVICMSNKRIYVVKRKHPMNQDNSDMNLLA